MEFDSLRSFGIEVLSVEDDGLVIGASTEGFDFESLKDKITNFLSQEGKFKDTAAKLWDINSGKKWRLDYILSKELNEKWEELKDDQIYTVDLSVSCAVYITNVVTQDKEESDEKFQIRLSAWRKRKELLEIQRDAMESERFDQLATMVQVYGGSFLSSMIGLDDSFCVRIEINGAGLKDIVFNYPYLFEVNEYDPYSIELGSAEGDNVGELEFIEPDETSPTICVIDSGIQENHKFLEKAIQKHLSKSFLPSDPSTVDGVKNGGHGTRVAGSVLFGNQIPKSGKHQFIAKLANARVLDQTNSMPRELYPPALMKAVQSHYEKDCKVFQLSINSRKSVRQVHMSDWASTIDQLNYETDSLFVISTGNINRETNFLDINNPSVKQHLIQGRQYPKYFQEQSAKIANPSQSAFSLTVGSICLNDFDDPDWKSFGKLNEPSAFTRSGPGIWGMVKPDVVEYGGDYVQEKNSSPNLITKEITSPETVRSTASAMSAIGRDKVGTSFSAPKVTHTIARILNQWPNASSLFIRSLVAQSARWPDVELPLSLNEKLELFGYGLPSLDRALENSQSRITFYTEGKISPKQAKVYKIAIPEELNRPGDSFDYLIEVSLAYKARIRRTRRGTKSYVSSWADWVSGHLWETDQQFQERVLQYASTSVENAEKLKTEPIKWFIREQSDWGIVKGFKRNDSTLQKSWANLKSYQLPEHLSIAVVGHAGWEKDVYKEEIPYCLMVSIECLHPEVKVYEKIRIHNETQIEIEV
ncbi:peptidase S8 [Leptospira bourretii]|uniref:Peptidase S8 n=2 Tax=Leptospira bourretii TaxID=2484962 RepID=A0A4R9IJ67_9LEPT|nr:peptidase S8 [Leptospira bourretii]TGK89217.1 peptidase S8 [Leptospira bourretii]TGL37944.1 peptidase S8 [Leptospira bourretii]